MPTPPLDPAERRRRLARMIRVDHAGEFGAQQIYAGQLAVLGDARRPTTLNICAPKRSPICAISRN